MLRHTSFTKLTRRGKLVKVLREHYLRDDIPCGVAGCQSCGGDGNAADDIDLLGDGTSAGTGAQAHAARMQTQLSAEPARGQYAVFDTNILLHQMDVIEAAGAELVADVLLMQTVLAETRHRSLALYQRIRALMAEPSRRFVAFANEHHRDTYVERHAGESANDYNDRALRTAASWWARHIAGAGSEARVLLVTNDAASAALARSGGMPAVTMREYVASIAGPKSPLLDLVAAAAAAGPIVSGLDADEAAAAAVEDTTALELAAGSVVPPRAAEPPAVPSRSLTVVATPSGASAAAVSVASSRGGNLAVGRRKALYAEHWSSARIANGLRTRAAFQGTLRVNRDCWFEARVTIHGVSGKSDSGKSTQTGGDDVVSVLIQGRDAINRAMEGDTVVIELLPPAQWRHPSTRLMAPGASAEQEDAEEAAALKETALAAGEVVAPLATASTTETAASQQAPLPPASPAAAAALPVNWEQAFENPDEALEAALPHGATAEAAAGTTASAAPAAVAEAPEDDAKARTVLAALRANLTRAAAAGIVPTARVVGIVKRAWRPYCGSLEPDAGVALSVGPQDGGGMPVPALFVPVDSKIPRIRIETRQKAALLDKRLVVALDSWDAYSKYPRGHYVRTLGVIGDKATENEVILLEHDIPTREFSADVMACLPPANWTPASDNRGPRRDLRHIDVCSVDPPGCKDIDDALHARLLPNGNVEVGVHIADVSHFVKHGTPIDVEASLRANTTYLVERRLDMLPGLLTETLCSLKQNVERFAFSVTWELRKVGGGASSTGAPLVQTGADRGAALTPASVAALLAAGDEWEFVPGRTEYFKSLILSRASLTYAQAQVMLDDQEAATPVALGIKILASVARWLKRGRTAAGALTLASPEVKIMLDSETHEPLDVMAYELRETNSMVEEFMLLANIAVARRIVESYPRCSLLRRHPAPPQRAFDALLAAAAAVGVTLRTDSSKALADSLDQAVVAHNPYFNKLLRILATRCMMQAVYFPSGEVPSTEYHHYGLATPIYTHFTLPIRRYADVVVHRLLAAALELEPLPAQYEDRAALRTLSDIMNRRHLMSQLAGRASSALHTNLFFKNRIVVEAGLVMRLRANGAVVLIPRFGIEGMTLLGRARDDARQRNASRQQPSSLVPQPENRVLVYDEAAQTLADAAAPEMLRLRVFDEVRVAVLVEERVRFRKELVFRIISPPFATMPSPAALPPGMRIDDRTIGRAGATVSANARGASASSVSAPDGNLDDGRARDTGHKRPLDANADPLGAASTRSAGARAAQSSESPAAKRRRA